MRLLLDIVFLAGPPPLFWALCRFLIWRKDGYHGRHRAMTRFGTLALALVSIVALFPVLFIPAMVIMLGSLPILLSWEWFGA